MFVSFRPPAPRAKRRRSVWALALFAAFASPMAYGQTRLSLDHALQLAQARSQQLAAQDTAADAAREMARAAGALPDPQLKAGINNLPIDGEDKFNLTRDFMTMRSIALMQEFTRADKRAARAARFEREADVAAATRVLALASLQRDTAMAWLERHYAERMRDVLSTLRDEARLQIDAADAAYRGARGPQADVFAARAAVAQIEDRIALNDRALATAQARLARWVGESAGLSLAPPPDMTALRIDASAIETEVASHPQIALLARREDVARAEANVASSNKRADWSVELMYSQRGPAYSNMVSINVSIPLQWDQKHRQDRELAARLSMTEQARAEREEATRERAAEVRTWRTSWQNSRDRLRRYDESLLPLAAERTRAALAAYRGGAGPLAALLEARRMEIDTRMERLRIEMDSAALWAQLQFVVPMDRSTGTSAKEQIK